MPSESVKTTINSAPNRPGVYRFLDASNEVIYVGKAKSLIKRLKSYLQENNISAKTARMIYYAENVEWTETGSETDALILEAKLIKQFSPRYNILLKDDKSYPFLRITRDEFPKIEKYRGKLGRSEYFVGPFISGRSLDSIISIVTQIFQIRTCSNTFFKSRTRPCLRYYVHRCSAPCTGEISKEEYDKSVLIAKNFLRGENTGLIKELTNKMMTASEQQQYEYAAILRDKIKLLSELFENNKGLISTHIVAITKKDGMICIRVFMYENNINLGSKDFVYKDQEKAEESFLNQFYYENKPPKEVLLNFELVDFEVYSEAYKTKFICPQRGFKRDLIEKCTNYTYEYLEDYLNKHASYERTISSIQETFRLKNLPLNIEVYDNTHMHGSHSYGGVVVFKNGEFIKSEYRLYKIEESNSDDYFMLRTVLERRFGKKDEPLPDLLLIDGGIGQFNTVVKTLDEIGVYIDVIAIAKGVNRNAFDETFFSREIRNFKFNKSDKILFFFERLRDEVHKYVISANRYAFKRSIKKSIISEINGIGASKKKALLKRFGSLECIRNATLEELMTVDGIGRELALSIYKFFHE